MNKRLTKPYDRNERLNAPLGLLGVPPDNNPPTPLNRRSRLKMLVLEADEATLDRIMLAIESISGARGVGQ